MRMRAAVLRRFGAPLEVTDVEVAAPGRGEVRVRVRASGICGSDVRAMAGGSVMARHLPCVFGHEAAGVVTEVGPGAELLEPGDHVIVAMNGPCGRCRPCGRGRPQLCTDPARQNALSGLAADGGTRLSLGGEQVRPYIGIGAFAEYVVVRERMCVPVDEDLPLELLALTACGVVTGFGAVFNTARVEHGSSVLVLGCGGVGLSVVQSAVLAGATEIIAVDTVAAKLASAERFGATRTVCLDAPDAPAGSVAGGGGAGDLAGGGRLVADRLAKEVNAAVPGGVDFAFDVTGAPGMLAHALAATCPGGTAVMVGIPPFDRPVEVRADLLAGGHRTLVGTQGGDALPVRDLGRLVEFYRAGRLDLEGLVGERVTLDGINEAVERVRTGSVARSLVVMD